MPGFLIFGTTNWKILISGMSFAPGPATIVWWKPATMPIFRLCFHLYSVLPYKRIHGIRDAFLSKVLLNLSKGELRTTYHHSYSAFQGAESILVLGQAEEDAIKKQF